MRKVIKNVGKFNKIKFAESVDLFGFKTLTRDVKYKTEVGESTKRFGNVWFVTPKGKAIFKTFDSSYLPESSNVRIYNELLCEKLCNQIGLDCAKYEVAHLKRKKGVISYCVLNKGEKLLNMLAFMRFDGTVQTGPGNLAFFDGNVAECANVLDDYISEGYNVNKKKVMQDLFKLTVFDTLTMQTDRNASNVNFIYNKSKKELRFAPVIDNEYAFCGEIIGEAAEYNWKMSFSDILKQYSKNANMVTVDNIAVKTKNTYMRNIAHIVDYSIKHKELGEILNNILNSIDVDKAIQEVESVWAKAPNEYKDFIKEVVEYSKTQIQKQIKKGASRKNIEYLEKLY